MVFAGLEGGYGNVLVIDHGYGIKTRYGHLSEIIVKAGERVKRGDVVAAVGNTGRSTGPHLHYEVRVNGIAAEPAEVHPRVAVHPRGRFRAAAPGATRKA